MREADKPDDVILWWMEKLIFEVDMSTTSKGTSGGTKAAQNARTQQQVASTNYINTIIGSNQRSKPSESEIKQAVNRVREVAPDWQEEDVLHVLEENNYNSSLAASAILDGSAGKPSQWHDVNKRTVKVCISHHIVTLFIMITFLHPLNIVSPATQREEEETSSQVREGTLLLKASDRINQEETVEITIEIRTVTEETIWPPVEAHAQVITLLYLFPTFSFLHFFTLSIRWTEPRSQKQSTQGSQGLPKGRTCPRDTDDYTHRRDPRST